MSIPKNDTAMQQTSSDTIVLHLSQDVDQGRAQFIASVDGKGLGAAQYVTAQHDLHQGQDFAFKGSFGAGPHDLAITFLREGCAGKADIGRDLFGQGIEYDGHHYAAVATVHSGNTVHFELRPSIA